jgi:hypothetical protein
MTQARRHLLPAAVSLALVFGLLPGLAPAADAASLTPVPTNVGCDPLDPSACLFPFPNNLFTTQDASSNTGVSVNFLPTAMPRNGTEITEGGEGKPVDPIEWNRNDGFSPGSAVMTLVPGLDLHATWGTQDRPFAGAPNEAGYFDHRDHIADIGLYAREDAPIVIINAATGERHPFWSELDSHRDAVAQGERSLILRPATNFEEGARYVVALRDLKASDGSTIEPRSEFVAYRNGTATDARQSYFNEKIFDPLQNAGIAKDDLYLAWDFTIASEENLAERILHMRDDAFGRILGDRNLADGIVQGVSPAFTVDRTSDKTETFKDSRGVEHTHRIRVVHGRVTVPNYLDRIQQTEGHVRGNQLPYDLPVPGSRLLDVDRDGRPEQNPIESTVNVPFQCEVPLNGQENFVTLYGHGLLGDRGQVGDIKSPRRAGPFLGCAADWWGMSTPDLPTVASILADFSNFPSLPDRAQQGFLNFMFLGRAAVHPDGFATNAAFQNGGNALVKVADDGSTPLFYDGNSQGGIMGGSLVAVSPDIQRGILGVTGMNYSTLLNRSVDWEGELKVKAGIPAYSVPFYESYRDPLERQIVFGLMQMLWDRGEANGYAAHMTDDPYANTPEHDVMLQVAWSDHQVANVSAEVEARTIGAPIMVPGLPEGRHWEMDPYFSDTATYPHEGSALVYWDSGNATPPNGNIPPSEGSDPHSHPRNEPAAAWQEAHFLLTGTMYDVCEGGDYLTLKHPSNGGTPSCHPPQWAAGTTPADEEDPEPLPTNVAVTDTSQDSGQYSDGTLFQAELTDENGPVPGAPVTFELAGAGSTRTFTATTDDNGLAQVTPVLTETPGSYTVTASYAGSEERAASTSSPAPFEVLHEDTDTVLSVVGQGSKRSLVATLTDSDSGEGVSGATLDFYADGSSIGTATTDGSGKASISIPARYRGGHHNFEARFRGDTFYLPSAGEART